MKELILKSDENFRSLKREVDEVRSEQGRHDDVLAAICDHLDIDIDFVPRVVKRGDGKPMGFRG